MTDLPFGSVTKPGVIHLAGVIQLKLNLFDSHVHSVQSHDGRDTTGEICAWALDHGVMGVCVTDHFECDIPDQQADIGKTLRETALLQEKNKGRIRLTRGVELAQGHLLPETASGLLDKLDFDFVLGSVHCAAPGTDIGVIDFNDPAVRVSEVLDAYFRSSYEMAKWGRFDAMAHFGYPERYIWGKYRIPVNFLPYEDLIQETLRLLAEGGKGLEVNTSGYRQGLGKTIPVLGILKRYYQLGGRTVTLGSDAHRAEDIAADFDVAMDILTGIGFQYFAFYRERQPVMLKLI